MKPSMQDFVVRIFKGSTAVGAGTLISAREVVTCLHVTQSVAGHRDSRNRFAENTVLQLDFPLIDETTKIEAVPAQWDAQHDICVLQLMTDAPQRGTAAVFVNRSDLWGHTFRAYGYPKNHRLGVWATGEIRGPNSKGWVQIVVVDRAGFVVQEGFSGGPVWDDDLGAVVGVVIAEDIDVESRTAYFVPTQTLLKLAISVRIKRDSGDSFVASETQGATTGARNIRELEAETREASSHRKESVLKPKVSENDPVASSLLENAEKLTQQHRRVADVKSALEQEGKKAGQLHEDTRTALAEIKATLKQIDEVLKLAPNNQYHAILSVQLSACSAEAEEIRKASLSFVHSKGEQRTRMRKVFGDQLHHFSLSLLQAERLCRSTAGISGNVQN